ncbi:MAG: polysaccharide lyase [Candidatus Methylumidiphilus sp.]
MRNNLYIHTTIPYLGALMCSLAAALAISGCADNVHAPIHPPPKVVELHDTVPMSVDYETGDFSQWAVEGRPNRVIIPPPLNHPDDNLTIVTSDKTLRNVEHGPVREGKYAAKVVVHSGDDPYKVRDGHVHSERMQIGGTQQQAAAFEGSEQWYAWSIYFPQNFNPDPKGWNNLVQWHHTPNGKDDPCEKVGPANIGFNVTYYAKNNESIWERGYMSFGSHGSADPECAPANMTTSGMLPLMNPKTTHLRPNHWYDFVFHVKWSGDPAQGFFEVWLDGNKVIPLTHASTLYAGHSANMGIGLYRGLSTVDSSNPSHDFVSTLYIDAIKRGNSYEAVSLRR